MPGNLSFAELQDAVASGEIDTVLVAAVDMQGRLMGKRFHAQHFVDRAWEETHACNYLLATDLEMFTVPGYAATSWAKGYGDYVLKPDLATLRRTPWLEGTALVLCDILDHHTHREVAHSPRAMLKAQTARLEAMGYRAMMATELEFYLFEKSFEALRADGYRGMAPFSAYNEDYHIFQTTKEEDVMRAIRNGLFGAGVPVENTKGEADSGQGEINIRYDEALETADTHVLVKNACKEIAWARGRGLTFLAKWSHTHGGSSSHIHQSLWSLEGKPAFFDSGAEHGMSALMRSWLAGQLAHAAEITYFLAPYVNSYKRFQAGTFAPTRICWSVDNRTAGFRLCGENSHAVRVECRIGGSDLNPYLAAAALIAAGIDGIERGLALEDAFTGDAYESDVARIPATLPEAAGRLDGSALMRSAFGDGVVDHYVRAARWEVEEYNRVVTDWEIARGFERA
ncbi:MAG: glutamine synthetase family protein [Alkalilacustris sp.]